jgi:uncharacterized lipoprotein YbaY
MNRRTLLSACLALAVSIAPVAAMAQTPAAPAAPAAATAADTKPFLGDWTISGESPMGPFSTALSIKAEGDKTSAVISSEIQPPTTITGENIQKSGNNLVLYYSFDFDGNSIPAVLTLALKEDKLDAFFSFADGAFEMGGVGTKTPAAAAN